MGKQKGFFTKQNPACSGLFQVSERVSVDTDLDVDIEGVVVSSELIDRKWFYFVKLDLSVARSCAINLAVAAASCIPNKFKKFRAMSILGAQQSNTVLIPEKYLFVDYDKQELDRFEQFLSR